MSCADFSREEVCGNICIEKVEQICRVILIKSFSACQRALNETGFYISSDGAYLCPLDYKKLTTPLVIRAEQPVVKKQSQLPSSPLGSPTSKFLEISNFL